MNKAITFLKSLHLTRIVLVFLAGIILLVSTACSQTPTTKASYMDKNDNTNAAYTNRTGDKNVSSSYLDKNGNRAPIKEMGNDRNPKSVEGSSPYQLKDIQAKHMQESYEIQPNQMGGVNEFRDVEASLDTSDTDAKASNLVNQAKRNLQRRATNPAEAVDNLKETASMDKVGDNLNKISNKIGRSVQETKEGVQEGVKNLQESVKSAPGYVSEAIQQTKNM